MNGLVERTRRLFRHYLLRREGDDPSPAVYWYLPEPARVRDARSLEAYLAGATPSPLFLMDYRRKLEYRLADGRGIPVLNYGPPVGRQVNPEVAFQIALAWHDRWRSDGDPADLERFLALARHFLTDRDGQGRWLYRFAWDRSPDPWYSPLAQSRGASVMIRAGLITGEPAFLAAAREGLAPFAVPLEQGGMRHRHPRTGRPYLEEYPFQPTAVLNGFMSSLFGLFEASTWLGDHNASRLLDEYLDTLEGILPHYSTGWWSLYDLDPESPVANVHSVRYHRLAIEYLRVLAAISGRAPLADCRDRWVRLDRPVNRVRATLVKAVKKAAHR